MYFTFTHTSALCVPKFGESLIQGRLMSGKTIEQLSFLTNVSVTKIRSMEEGFFDLGKEA